MMSLLSLSFSFCEMDPLKSSLSKVVTQNESEPVEESAHG